MTKKKKTKKYNSKNIDPRSKRIYDNMQKLNKMIIEYSLTSDKKKRELTKITKNITKKLDKIKAGAHNDSSLNIARGLYNNIIIHDEAVINEYLDLLDSGDYNETSDKLLELANDRNLIKENKDIDLNKFYEEKNTNENLYVNKLRCILISDDIIAGGLDDSPKDIEIAEKKLRNVFKKAIDKGSAGSFTKMGQKLITSRESNKLPEERAFALSSFFMNSITNATDSNEPVNIDGVIEEKKQEIQSSGADNDKYNGDINKQASEMAISEQVEKNKDPCHPGQENHPPDKKTAWVREKKPMCIDKGAFYNNILQVIGLALGPASLGLRALMPD